MSLPLGVDNKSKGRKQKLNNRRQLRKYYPAAAQEYIGLALACVACSFEHTEEKLVVAEDNVWARGDRFLSYYIKGAIKGEREIGKREEHLKKVKQTNKIRID